jgi:hypothetical protein
MADIALVPLEGADQCLGTVCEHALRPLVIGAQPAQNTLLQR